MSPCDVDELPEIELDEMLDAGSTERETEVMEAGVTRRQFLGGSGILTVGAALGLERVARADESLKTPGLP